MLPGNGRCKFTMLASGNMRITMHPGWPGCLCHSPCFLWPGAGVVVNPLHFSNHLGIKTRRARSVYYATGFVFARFFPSGSPWSGGCFYLFGVCAAARTVTASPAAWSIADGDETTGVRFWGAGASGTQPTAVVDHCAYGRINPHHLYFLWVLAHSYFAK